MTSWLPVDYVLNLAGNETFAKADIIQVRGYHALIDLHMNDYSHKELFWSISFCALSQSTVFELTC